MEEFIGGLWHRFITRAATRSYPQAAARLVDMERTAGILFRALGGDPGLRVAPAAETEHGARRGWLARIAHVGEKAAHAARDDETLRLPAEIALFPERSHNRDLYLWLIAQGAALPADGLAADNWIAANQAASVATLAVFPGFAARYRLLVEAVVAERPDPRKLAPDEAGPEPVRVVGIPASIDNDLGLTGLSIGVDTAMNTIVEACDKIADTATAHDRTFIIEVMGRDCGYLAMTSAIAAGADLALFPEAGRDEATVVDSIVDTVLAVRQRQRRSRRVIIIKAEGVAIRGGGEG